MKVLYKDELENLAVIEVAKVSYDAEERVLALCGPEDDIAVQASLKEAERIIRELYQTDQADVTAFKFCEMEYEYDDDDYDEVEDEEFEAMLDRILDDSQRDSVLRFK